MVGVGDGTKLLMKNLKVLMIDFGPVVQAGLSAMLAADQTIDLTGHAGGGDEALVLLAKASGTGKPIDVVLTQTRTPEMDGVQVTRLIKEQFPDTAVLVLTENDNDSNVIDAIHAGAGGYIFLRDMAPGALVQAVHRVTEGGPQMTTVLLRSAVDALLQNGRKTLAERTTEAAHLTEREVDVLRLMGNGDSNKAIAATLDITLDTVKKHARNVVYKLQATSRTHAAIIAAQAGIVGPSVAPVERELEALMKAA